MYLISPHRSQSETSPKPRRTLVGLGERQGGMGYFPNFFFHALVSAGTSVNKSPTTPVACLLKMGASASLLMATMTFAVSHADEMLDRARDAAGDV